MEAELVKSPEYQTVDRTILERYDELIQRYGAHHIGVSKKYTGGEKLPETSITFYVLKKGEEHGRMPIPPYLDLKYKDGSYKRRIVTDVCDIKDEPRGFNIRGGSAVFSADNEEGTVGLVFRDNGRDFLVTNAHVVTDPGASRL